MRGLLHAGQKLPFANGAFCSALLLFLSLAGGMLGGAVAGAGSLFPFLLCCALFVGAVCAVWWSRYGGVTEGRAVALLFLLALAARLCYILLITVRVNQHDVYYFGYPAVNHGHTGYIEFFLQNGRLPDGGEILTHAQFYHPPLHHIVCALFLRLQTALGVPFDAAAENLQALTLFYSMVALYACYRVLKLLGLRGGALFAPLALLAFHPTFFLLSGSINNDCLSVMFCLLAVWAALAWYRKPTFPRVLALALGLGGGMAAKLSVGVLAPAVAVLFLIRLVRTKGWGMDGRGRLLLQFCLFGVVCIPLGIGWQARNFLLYGIPPDYLPHLSAQSKQYLGDYPLWTRFFDFGTLRDFGVFPSCTGEYGAAYFEHCIPLAILKMSLFGEYGYWTQVPAFEAVGTFLFGLNLLVVGGSLGGMGVCTVSAFRTRRASPSPGAAFARKNGISRSSALFLLLAWAFSLYGYTAFCFKYPHFCSMDFRYIVPTLLYGAVFLGVLLSRLHARATRPSRLLCALLYAAVAAFCACSVLLYPFFFGT